MESARRSGGAGGVTYLGKADEIDGVYDLEHLEHLPPLLEDEENVSLADILSLRDTCLSEDEVWAVCGECAVALQSIGQSQLFHSLCITPDTLAFNAHGNVCFMEQLSDDPEGSFVPPEFDSTGSTSEGHVFSLGSTLSAALSFVIEPELEVDLGPELTALLEQMQQEQPEDRPTLKSVLSLSQSHLCHASSAAVCRRMSSAGRRVLSIESFQDGAEGSWEARWQRPEPRCLSKRPGSEDDAKNLRAESPIETECLSRQQVCSAWDSSLWAEDMDSGIGHSMNFRDELDFRSYDSSPVMRRAQAGFSRIRGALNRSCSVPDSNNPPALSPTSCGDISFPVSDLSEIGGDEDRPEPAWRLEKRLNRGGSCDCYAVSTVKDYMNSPAGLNEPLRIEEEGGAGERREDAEDWLSPCNSCQDLELERDSCGKRLDHGLGTNNHMTKSMLCLNQESQDEWIPLRELLSRCGRRLSVNELWALCHTCLSSLQTYIDFPAYLSLDTVYVGCEGEVLFLKPKNIGYCDEFYLAPEYQEHGIVTEKVCVYGIAAILWAAAKFNLSANQKLAMPRKLKRLLLEMAKQTPIERPTIVTAKKSCRDYLSRQGTSAETVWERLICRVHKPVSKYIEDSSMCEELSNEDSSLLNSGFVPTATESRLAPVPGPVPHSYPVDRELRLPEAFTSTATHFTPIILTSQDAAEKSPSVGDELEGYMEGFVDSSENIDEIGLDSFPTSEDPQPPADPDSCAATEESRRPAKDTPAASTPPPPDNPAPVTSDPDLPDVSHIEVSLSSLNSNLNNCGVFNNYLFRQDPKTGQLCLVPVRVRAPDSVRGLDINLSLVPPSLKGLLSNPEMSNGTSFDSLAALDDNCSASIGGKGQNRPATPSGRAPVSPAVHPALQEVIDLLKGEFTLNAGLDNGHGDVAMGEYIFSLKALECRVFADVVKERFSDLYWDEDLLGVLHCLVNYSSAPLPYRGSDDQAASKPVKRASGIEAAPPGGRGEERRELCLDLNGNIHPAAVPEAGPEAVDEWDPDEPRARHGQGTKSEHDLGPEQRQRGIFQGVSTDSSDTGAMEGGERSAGAGDESLSEAELALGRDEASMDLEDSDSGASDRRLSPGAAERGSAGAEGAGRCPGAAWDLAFYEGRCFGDEVVEYAAELGQHTGAAPCVDVKTQEVQQQLIIEKRNLRKTRNFYHKLLQQERKNKGSENKVMLSKLKSQLEELRSRVIFLESVKKYLEVLSLDQWGLELSLLPSLADCGADALELQSSEDSSVLSFSCCEGQSVLQLGSPLGLMAHLYTRNAAMGGYIQQLLYTFRYFCTSDELLHFIMNKFMSAAKEGPDLSGDSLKVFHRSLDLLQLWISDCKEVDFTGRSSLVDTLENFINTQVIPLDSRGDALLSALHGPTHSALAQDRGSQLSLVDEDDLVGLHSSTEDLGKRWRISRMMEPSPSLPKDKSFSIAAALPVPCYGSTFDEVPGPCVPGSCVPDEERLPFCHSDFSPQHLAQQLTLLQQEIFGRCHPVHFLNSRTQGVTDNALSTNKNVSSPVCPAEGGDALQQLLSHSDRVSHWVCAEVLLCDSVKTQAALLTKYLWIGKHCYESRNFATAVQILGGLENVIVRQLPAWKQLPTKVCEILEELRAVQVFLKSDDLCLMGGDHPRRRPTLPSAHILALHVQQLEIGAFKLTTGAYKWNKLRRIAKVVSQVHAFQEAVFPYIPDRDLQSYLRVRMARTGSADIQQLASGNQATFQPTSERQARRIHDTLRRVKASFQ
ncbi:kinase non-catalytic C-lobe domain-containing protein 1 [Eucyclogobius newberryi]|uniref:kinase non-catalytic C-lobe domain-containing protein 1 n=1 Tax=Eucyclogobius newberryi TaxID=166745 RepID=UPI003B5ACBA0